MKNYSRTLEKLFQDIPVYGYGSVVELERVFLDYTQIVEKLAARKSCYEITRELGARAAMIGHTIRLAISTSSKKDLKIYFEKASNELGLDIESLIWNIDSSRLYQETGIGKMLKTG